jgi:hypothetical protein
MTDEEYKERNIFMEKDVFMTKRCVHMPFTI